MRMMAQRTNAAKESSARGAKVTLLPMPIRRTLIGPLSKGSTLSASGGHAGAQSDARAARRGQRDDAVRGVGAPLGSDSPSFSRFASRAVRWSAAIASLSAMRPRWLAPCFCPWLPWSPAICPCSSSRRPPKRSCRRVRSYGIIRAITHE